MRRAIPLTGFLVLLIFAYLTAIQLAYVLVYAGLLTGGVSWYWARSGSRGLKLTREGPGGAYQVGEVFTERLRLHNSSALGLPWVEVIDRSAIAGYDAGRVVSVSGRDHVEWYSGGRFMRRGQYQLGPTELVTGDPFGLFQHTRKVLPQSSVIIYPKLIEVARLLPGAWHTSGEFFGQGRHTDAPPDVYGIREYDASDGFNRIHWSSTARLGRLMSKTFEKLEGSDVMIVLDLHRRSHRGEGAESTLECGVTLAASVAVEVLNRGQSVGLGSNDRRRTSLRAARGTFQLNRILEFLAVAEADGINSIDQMLEVMGGPRDFQSLVVITPSDDGTVADRLLSTARGWKRRTSVFQLRDAGTAAPDMATGTPHSLDQLSWWSFAVDDPIFAADKLAAHPEMARAG